MYALPALRKSLPRSFAQETRYAAGPAVYRAPGPAACVDIVLTCLDVGWVELTVLTEG